ncbi:MAG TPA: P-II family nitrogen regulator [Clostridiales bacterium]|nr:P-II family nitrogen regulator [Clostridiales bacterium]
MEMLFFTVLNRGKANAVLHQAKEYGAAGGTIFYGTGTVQSKLMEKMGLTETHKEILMISATDQLCDDLHKILSENLNFSKRNKGIAFTIPFRRWKPKDFEQGQEKTTNRMEPPYFCIMTIIDKGRSRDCVKAARAAGARGGTIIHGRGAGIPTDFYFPLVIEPQKDIVMIVTTKDKVTSIREKIISDLELEKAGNGIIFILPVIKASGLFENRLEERKGVTP